MKIAFVQMRCQFGCPELNRTRLQQLLASCPADFYVAPELFHSGYLFTSQKELAELAESIPEGETVQFLIRLAREKTIYIVAGIAENSNGQFYNSSVLVGPDGFIDIYRKVHLFGEEKIWFQPGNLPFRVQDLGMAKIGMMICFDWIFPEAARSLALQGAEIICHPSNLVLPYCQSAMPIRALENRVFTITANRVGSDQRGDRTLAFTGQSLICSPAGQVLAQASPDQEQVYSIEIEPELARNKHLTKENQLWQDRRPQFYQTLIG